MFNLYIAFLKLKRFIITKHKSPQKRTNTRNNIIQATYKTPQVLMESDALSGMKNIQISDQWSVQNEQQSKMKYGE